MKTLLFPLSKAKKPKLERLRDAYTNAQGLGPDNFRRRRREIREKAETALRNYERKLIEEAKPQEQPCEPLLPL